MSPILLLAAAGVALLLLAGLGPAAAGKRRLAGRARGLGRTQRGGLGREVRLAKPGATRLDILALRILPRPAVLRARLEATGLPIGVGQYAAASAAVGAAALALGLLLGAPPVLAVLGALTEAVVLPHLAVGVLMGRRRGRFLKVFPEAIALIVRGLRAGLPVTETLGVVGREIADPVGAEFQGVADQVRLGAPVEEALWRSARRIGLPEFNFLVISLSVQRETGGNLAETLENLEQILRRRQQMRLKIKAMSSEATASALIIGCLPFVMAGLMTFTSPDYMALLVSTPLGRLLVAGGLGSLLVGALVMRQMVRFEI